MDDDEEPCKVTHIWQNTLATSTKRRRLTANAVSETWRKWRPEKALLQLRFGSQRDSLLLLSHAATGLLWRWAGPHTTGPLPEYLNSRDDILTPRNCIALRSPHRDVIDGVCDLHSWNLVDQPGIHWNKCKFWEKQIQSSLFPIWRLRRVKNYVINRSSYR